MGNSSGNACPQSFYLTEPLLMQGTVKGGRRQGRQRKRWEDNIREWTGLELGKSQKAVENREKWRKLVAKSSVVPQWPSWLRDRWDDKMRELGWWVRTDRSVLSTHAIKRWDLLCDILVVVFEILPALVEPGVFVYHHAHCFSVKTYSKHKSSALCDTKSAASSSTQNTECSTCNQQRQSLDCQLTCQDTQHMQNKITCLLFFQKFHVKKTKKSKWFKPILNWQEIKLSKSPRVHKCSAYSLASSGLSSRTILANSVLFFRFSAKNKNS